MNQTVLTKFSGLILLFALSINTWAQSDVRPNYVILEGGALWQSKNDQRVPGNSGTHFLLGDFSTGPFGAYRIYLGRKFSGPHEARLLYAPLEINLSGKFSSAVDFNGKTFAANTETNAFYKFNSYRASYIYHFEKLGNWDLAVGFTAKIRDAEVRVTQGSISARKANVGFVPLLHFQAQRELFEKWQLIFDMDGLAAPQGRAFDIAIKFERELSNLNQSSVFFGYRTIEGGADNDRVYNFAWFHIATLGLNIGF